MCDEFICSHSCSSFSRQHAFMTVCNIVVYFVVDIRDASRTAFATHIFVGDGGETFATSARDFKTQNYNDISMVVNDIPVSC